jgi:hypothetical protein
MRSRVAGPVSVLAATGVAAAGVAAVASTGGSGGDSGIRGRVVPCGLIHERAARCAFSPAGAKVVVRAATGSPAVAVARADRRGRFRVELAPGTYALAPRPTGAPREAKPLDVEAVVPDAGWVTVVVPAGRMAPPTGRLGLR